MTNKALFVTVSARPRFSIGCLVITRNALDLLTEPEIARGLARHIAGDWGELPFEDARANEDGLIHGDRLLSAYGQGERRFWIITEADRSVTTILLPNDY